MSTQKKKLSSHANYKWGLAGIALVSPLLAISAISPEFDYPLRNVNKPIIALVALMISAGVVYLLVVCRLKNVTSGRNWLAWVISVGLLARLAMFASTPALEDDYYRYLWNGGVLANGFNPYKYSPKDILEGGQRIPSALRQLAEAAEPIPHRVNYPWLRSIYPPVTECAFALAHIISPWSMNAWRLILLVMDSFTLWLLLQVFRRLSLPTTALVIYWWNPLLIKETYNSGHMDVILLPFLVGALLLSIRRRHLLASGTLGLAFGVKFWPVILLPAVLRPALRKPTELIPAVLIFASISTFMFLPFLFTGLGADSGFRAYTRYWEMNDALFMLILWVVRFLMTLIGQNTGYAQVAARALVVCILLAWSFQVLRGDTRTPLEICRRFLFISAALFLLSPTQFPWYSIWILPFLTMHFRFSLSLLTVLLPLYYLRFYWSARGMVGLHDYGIVWLEFVPIYLLLIREWMKGRKEGPTEAKEVCHNEGRS